VAGEEVRVEGGTKRRAFRFIYVPCTTVTAILIATDLREVCPMGTNESTGWGRWLNCENNAKLAKLIWERACENKIGGLSTVWGC
jgi:hypothetical protein